MNYRMFQSQFIVKNDAEFHIDTKLCFHTYYISHTCEYLEF
jgi:hypothetical protein